MIFYNRDSIKGQDGRLLITLEIFDKDVNHLYRDMTQLQELFSSHKLDPDMTFDEDSIKIILD